MADESQDQDRTEDATPFKLKEAKRRGQVSKSLEVNSFLMLGMLLMMVYMAGESMIKMTAGLSRELLSQSGQYALDANFSLKIFDYITSSLFDIFWPLILGAIVIAVLSNMFQTGPVFSFFPIKPDIKRINPISGLKRIFSMKTLFESFKSIIKLVLFGTVIYFAISGAIPVLLAALDISPSTYPKYFLGEMTSLMGKLLLVLLVLALLDYMFTQKDFAKKMRMSRRDVKDEVKRRDGDPHIRSRQRELQREAAKRSGSLARVPEADVLITNPTHLSIALKYERGVMLSPELLAKGAGELAMKMREVARKHNIPIVENKRLARALFKKTEINSPIPEEYFANVAKILVWIFSQREQKTVRSS